MCGINGIFLKDSSSRVDEADILRMRDCMTHRGPTMKARSSMVTLVWGIAGSVLSV